MLMLIVYPTDSVTASGCVLYIVYLSRQWSQVVYIFIFMLARYFNDDSGEAMLKIEVGKRVGP